MTIFTCFNQFEDMMTCIYDAWDSKLGHKNIRLLTEPVGNLELFCDYLHVDADKKKTASVINSIQNKISFEAYQMVFRCAMSQVPDKLDVIYRFLLFGFTYGSKVVNMLQIPAVSAIFEVNRSVLNEAHQFQEFLRFTLMQDNVLVSHIEPRSDILTFLAPQFEDRMPSENWMIIDDNRKTAVVHPTNSEFYLTSLSNEEFDRLKLLEDHSDPYIDLWKGFFETIGIKERKNYKCQRNHIPLWCRKHVTEF
ncbi:TIGR03915 family putative DNA repair protein [Novisyntrophococcus fermenticellae]|uniref:TIGR03915 family putative DNA repair protein n=1 Tax=Novisyntrophococcus fermenticellae TaxID=2068655 RepID=UPI001E5467DF|nr:TIGR03915 family putative DNA repair protein [Novisyntrophococcus fermenticellae]